MSRRSVRRGGFGVRSRWERDGGFLIHPHWEDLSLEEEGQGSGQDENSDHQKDDEFPAEDRGVEEDELGIDHGAKDHEGEFGAVAEVGEVRRDEGIGG